MSWPDLVPWIIGTTIALAAIGAGVWWWLAARDARRAQVRKQHTMSASRDMLGRREIAVRHLSNPDRMVFGKLVDAQSAKVLTEQLVMDDSDAPCEVLGAPGSGKSHAMLAPACVRHRGPALISTTKLDLAQQTLGARGVTTSPVIFDPAEATSTVPELTARVRVWTPITEGVTWDRARRAAHAMLTAVRGAEGAQQGNAFWVTHSTTVVAALLVYLRAKPGSSLLDLIEQVKSLGVAPDEKGEARDEWEELLRRLGTMAAEQKDAAALGDHEALRNFDALDQARLALSLTASAAKATETRAGILGSVAQVIEGLIVARQVLRQKWDDDSTLDLGKMPEMHTLYLVCPRVDVRPLTNALLGAYVEELQRRAEARGGSLDRQHLICLDELVHCTPHRDLLSWTANVARSARIKFLLCTQSVSDLIGVYGQNDADSIRNACTGGKILFASTTDSVTLRAYSELAGKRELVQEQSMSVSVTKSSNYKGALKGIRDSSSTSKTTQRSKNLVEKDAATPARLAAMQTFHALVWLPGRPDTPGGAVQVRAIPMHEDADLVAAARGDREALARVQHLPDLSAWEPTQQPAPRLVDDADEAELDEAA